MASIDEAQARRVLMLGKARGPHSFNHGTDGLVAIAAAAGAFERQSDERVSHRGLIGALFIEREWK